MEEEKLDFIICGVREKQKPICHCYQEGGKDARDNSIEWSYTTKVSASLELYEVYIGPLIRLWWTNVGFGSGWRWPFWH